MQGARPGRLALRRTRGRSQEDQGRRQEEVQQQRASGDAAAVAGAPARQLRKGLNSPGVKWEELEPRGQMQGHARLLVEFCFASTQ